jgi:hypothetical protein
VRRRPSPFNGLLAAVNTHSFACFVQETVNVGERERERERERPPVMAGRAC